MNYFDLDFFGITRKLPIISITSKVKIASLSLLGDVELTEIAAQKLAEKLSTFKFDYLVGPEVKVVPLLHSLSLRLNKKHFIVCRKSIKGYMLSPLVLDLSNGNQLNKLVIDGSDAMLVKNKKVLIVDDVVSSGNTIKNLKSLLLKAGAEIVAVSAIFKQGDRYQDDLIYLSDLPVFSTDLTPI